MDGWSITHAGYDKAGSMDETRRRHGRSWAFLIMRWVESSPTGDVGAGAVPWGVCLISMDPYRSTTGVGFRIEAEDSERQAGRCRTMDARS